MIERVEQAPSQLPTHERQRRAGVRPMQRRSTWRWRIGRPAQVQPAVGQVANLGDVLRCDRCGWDAAGRRFEHLDVAAPITHTDSMAIWRRAG